METKKIFSLLASIAILLSLLACGDSTSNSKANRSANQNKETDALTDIETPEEEKIKNTWEIRYYVDEFKQPTSNGYVTNKQIFQGTFSNTATTDSMLKASILADECNISIRLWEYGHMAVKSTHNKDYDITILKPDGNKEKFEGLMNGDRMYIGGYHLLPLAECANIDIELNLSAATLDMLSILQNGGDVSFYIVESDRPSTTYLFTVDASGFAEEYDKFLAICDTE